MESKTDAALILEAELLAKQYWYHDAAECPGVDLAHKLAWRLKAANERNAELKSALTWAEKAYQDL